MLDLRKQPNINFVKTRRVPAQKIRMLDILVFIYFSETSLSVER